MKTFALLFCVIAAGCATTPAQPTSSSSPSGAVLPDRHQLYCDMSYPKIGLTMYQDVEDDLLVRERVDADGDGVIDRVIEYRRVDDSVTGIWSDGKQVGEMRRSEDKIVSDWQEPPRQDVFFLDKDGRIVRVETDDMVDGVEGKDGQVDAVRTLVYDGEKIVEEVTKRDGLTITQTNEYGEDGRRTKSLRVATGLFAETQHIAYSYDDGRCLATVN